ncbi:glycoside hydrolase family 9 protein [Pseudahrensia aquimaris]|uniref:Glycoside hydrolase family 9 protein n=1 Tax=Pseudahrensia aquimaris TaxID=744461 RepID=A0ABW3FBK2_9HYPH
MSASPQFFVQDPNTDLQLSTVGSDTIQLRFELGRVIDAAQTTELPDGVTSDQFGQWIYENGQPLGRVTPDGQYFQAIDQFEASPLADLFTSGALDDSTGWTITLNGEEIAIDTVSRKANIEETARVGESIFDAEFATIESVFLKLNRPVADGDTLSIAFNDNQFETLELVVDRDATVSEAVHVNLTGYDPDDVVKTAYLSSWNGFDAARDRDAPAEFEEGTAFALIDESTGEAVFEGTATLDVAATEVTDFAQNFNKTDVFALDFSAFEGSGTFHINVEGVGISQSFTIDDNHWAEVFDVAASGFYHQRSGIALEEEFTDWTRPASLPEGTEVQITTVRIDQSREGYNPSLEDPFEKFAENLTGETVDDLFGGWHDAGDFDRRPQHLEASRKLIELVEIAPEFAEQNGLSIPEQDNALPDILDEALWNVDFFMRMQRDDGSVLGGLETNGPPDFAEGSWGEAKQVYAYGADPWTAWEFAATAAKAAFVVEAYDEVRAAEYLSAAERAMAWAEDNIGEANLSAPEESLARNLATAELYRATGDEAYNQLYLATTNYTQEVAEIDFTEHQYEAAFTYSRTELDGVDQAVAQRGIEDLIDEVRELEEFDRGAWGQTWNPFVGYGFGATHSQPSYAADIYTRLHALTGEEKYLELAQDEIQFALGANPLNMSYLTGVSDLAPNGVRQPGELLVVDADTLGRDAPPGIVAYGGADVKKFGGFYTDTVESAIYPAGIDSPITESFNGYFFNVPVTEYTVQQGLMDVTFVSGYLASLNGVDEATAPDPVEPEPVEPTQPVEPEPMEPETDVPEPPTEAPDGVTLFGTQERDTLNGSSLDDILQGLGGDDFLVGGAGDDLIYLGNGDDGAAGDEGNDTIRGGAGNDSIWAGEGDDRALGGTGDDLLFGDVGNDILNGGTGNDELIGSGGDDILRGGEGDDDLRGGLGADKLHGGAGDDVINGQWGDDVLSGGEGEDVFEFVRWSGNDTVLDFDINTDKLNFSETGTDGLVISQQGMDLMLALEEFQISVVLKGMAEEEISDFDFV